MTIKKFIGHYKKQDASEQSVEIHLFEVSQLAGELASKIGCQEAGKLIGLMHDFGKFSQEFQIYIRSAVGLINPDQDDYVDAKGRKGKIDHSSAGAQWIWNQLKGHGQVGKACGQILALCVASHHSGLIDCFNPEGVNVFINRMKKADDKTHLDECKTAAPTEILEQAYAFAGKSLIAEMSSTLCQIDRHTQDEQAISGKLKDFYFGAYLRFLFSCLIDADRISSADFENPANKQHRNGKVDWSTLVGRAESHLSNLGDKYDINEIRRTISDQCRQRATEAQGIYSLTVPTGGGKTFASLRYALHHAEKHKLERIIYVIPYTSIIDQNASAIREVVERTGDAIPWVLEHHSNLEPDTQTWHSKLASENWDAPIILTTMVQFLETLFNGGTRSVRRMHQLANSVIIFDEIQTLPINCTHIFCNAMNFLSCYTRTTAVLCTATQPLLNRLREPEKGELNLPNENELIGDREGVNLLFKQLERVTIVNKITPQGWSKNEIAALAKSELENTGSCLAIVNTKAWAKDLYEACVTNDCKSSIFYLSTNLCPAHRKEILASVGDKLKNSKPVLCISTQLIEAGVDLDFGGVIRFLAGLDSIAQAAGRCNRNNKRENSKVYVVNPAEESIDFLTDIKVGREIAGRIFRENDVSEILTPEVMDKYFDYYFFERSDEMAYPVSEKYASRRDNLLSLLSDNGNVIVENASIKFRQSFKTAGDAFKAIDAPTMPLIVPYGEGKEVITNLCAISKDFDAAKYYHELKKAQQYSVNVFPHTWQKLVDEQAIYEIQNEGIYYLNDRYYSDKFGVSTEAVNPMEFMEIKKR